MQVATCDGPPPAVPHLIPVVSRHRYGFVHFADTEEGEMSDGASSTASKLNTMTRNQMTMASKRC